MKQAFFFFTLLFSTNLLAQNTAIKGKIVDENKEALTGVNVIADVSKSLATQTDFDGNYSLNLPAGSYRIIYSFIGKEDQ